MTKSLNKWYQYLVEQTERSERFNRNIETIKKTYIDSGYSNFIINLIDTFTPENAKILNEVDLEEDQKGIMGGAYSKVFPIKGTDRLLKLFAEGVNVSGDIKRMKKVVDQVFKGDASLGEMHFFEFGTLGDVPKDDNQTNVTQYFKYVLMPRIIPFDKSAAYREEPDLFKALSPAVQSAARSAPAGTSYTDFFERVMNYFTYSLRTFIINRVPPQYVNQQIEEFANRTEDFQDTISKIVQAAYKAFSKEGGTDLHFGNLGYFPQKPDDFFYFDM